MFVITHIVCIFASVIAGKSQDDDYLIPTGNYYIRPSVKFQLSSGVVFYMQPSDIQGSIRAVLFALSAIYKTARSM